MVNIINKKFAFVILIVFLFANFCSAISVGNLSDSLGSSYKPGDKIKGWINVSLENEPIGAILESPVGETIKLIDLISKSAGFVKICNPSSCKSNYEITGEALPSKTFEFAEGENESLFGFKIEGPTFEGITDSTFNLDISSTNPKSTTFPLSIDILNDGTEDWLAYVSTGEFGDPDFGCFDGTGEESAEFGTGAYCGKITLSETPVLQIGAYVIGEEEGEVKFKMNISKIGTSGKSGTCDDQIVSGIGVHPIKCIPKKDTKDFSIKRGEAGDYLICIRKYTTPPNPDYKIRFERNNACGFSVIAPTQLKDFEIFASQGEYAETISFTLNDTELLAAGSKLTKIENNITKYISLTYNDDCTDGCVIPIRIFSGIAQEVTVSNARFEYSTEGVPKDIEDTADNIYDITTVDATISSQKFQKLSLDYANFTIPSNYGNYSYDIKLDGEKFFTKKMTITKAASITLTPTTTAKKFPTKFTAEVLGGNITEYKWNFGDGSAVKTTTKNEATHTYNNSGIYSLNITVKDNRGAISTKDFSVTVAKASEIVPTLLSGADAYLESIEAEMENFSEFEKNSVDYTLNLSSIAISIGEMSDAILTAVTESDYESILTDLLSINLPMTIAKTTTSEGVIFYPMENNIDLDLLKKIGGGNYTTEKESDYKNAILAWHNNNIESSLAYSEISLIYEDTEKYLKVFDIHIKKKGADTAYLIIQNMGNFFLQNKEDYTAKEGYFYTELDGEKDIRFSTTGEADLVNIPMFISPSLDNLAVIEITPPEKPNWTLPIIIAIIIILMALTIWAILQIWYIRKYEGFLFKDRNHLYNIMNYIGDAKKKGEKNSDISAKLRKTGWKSEQVAYAIKKYERKNTGLPEIIPIRKLLEGPKRVLPTE